MQFSTLRPVYLVTIVYDGVSVIPPWLEQILKLMR